MFLFSLLHISVYSVSIIFYDRLRCGKWDYQLNFLVYLAIFQLTTTCIFWFILCQQKGRERNGRNHISTYVKSISKHILPQHASASHYVNNQFTCTIIAVGLIETGHLGPVPSCLDWLCT